MGNRREGILPHMMGNRVMCLFDEWCLLPGYEDVPQRADG